MSIDTKLEIARHNRECFTNAYTCSGHEKHIADSIRLNKMYAGDQWEAKDKKRLDKEGRPALTLNLMLSTCNAILGEQLERKIDLSYSPGVGGDTATAFALNNITRSILAANRFEDAEEEVFADGIISDRGFYDCRLDFENNVNGEIAITPEDNIDVVIDPSARRYDPKTWNEVYISRWMTPDEIEVEYGEEHREAIMALAELFSDEDDGVAQYEYEQTTFGEEKVYQDSDEQKRVVKRIRVIERQYYKLTRQLHFVDLETGDIRPVPHGVEKADADKLAEEYGCGIMERPTRRVRITVSAGDVLLFDDWSLYRRFTIIPFFPYFRRGKAFGVARNIEDPQHLVNKTSSQELHIVNTTANSGWVVQENSLVDMDAEDLEERGAETGLVLTYKMGAEKPEKIKPNQIPTGIERISAKGAQTIREVSAVNASMLGASRADQSGTAQNAAISRGQIQVSVVLNNLLKTRRMLVEHITEIVQDYYDDTRYFRIAASESLFGGIATDDESQTFAINEPGEDDGDIRNDVTVGKYNVEVTHAPAGGSLHDIQMAEAERLRGLGVQIPDHVLVEYSRLEKRKELSEFLKQSQGFGEKTEEQEQLEEFQQQHMIKRLETELEDLRAGVAVKMANAEAAGAKADSMAGLNTMQLELAKLKAKFDEDLRDKSLRIALSARSHENSNHQKDKQIASQVALKAMDIANAPKPTPQEKERD